MGLVGQADRPVADGDYGCQSQRVDDRCKICGDVRLRFGDAVLMGHRPVVYYRCGSCGFVQTEAPDWLDEAYSDVIHETDIGHVSRNLSLARATVSVITAGFNADSRFLDFGGGYGMLVRLLRDRGLDFYRDDPYCDNLFARGFDRTGTSDDGYELVTAFEVAEHLPDPIEGFAAMFRRSDSVLFSTELLPDPPPAPGAWWYYSLESGQHVSLYTPRALAEQTGRCICSRTIVGRCDGSASRPAHGSRITPRCFADASRCSRATMRVSPVTVFTDCCASRAPGSAIKAGNRSGRRLRR